MLHKIFKLKKIVTGHVPVVGNFFLPQNIIVVSSVLIYNLLKHFFSLMCTLSQLYDLSMTTKYYEHDVVTDHECNFDHTPLIYFYWKYECNW